MRFLISASPIMRFALSSLVIVVLLVASRTRAACGQSPDAAFLKRHCYDCHQGPDAEGGLDLAALSRDLTDSAARERWIRIYDRVNDHEMPPKDASTVTPAEADAFLRGASDWLISFQRSQNDQFGRVRGRRLTRRELERSLHDLLGIDIPLADQLPEEARTAGFTTVATGQSMSHFQLQRHLEVVDVALDEAFRRATSPEDVYERDFDVPQIARRSERLRTREPEILDGSAVVWSSGLIYYGRIPATTAPESGWYRFKVNASGLKLPETGGVWASVRSGPCVSSAPLLAYVGALEAFEQPGEWEFETWLPRGHMLEIRPGDTTLKKARFAGGQVGNGEGSPQDVPGIAVHRITMQRIHHGPASHEIRQLLFGEMQSQLDAASPSSRDEAGRLVHTFARRAFRRPVTAEETDPFVGLVQEALDDGQSLAAALRVGYRAILCSPRFLYLTEQPGRLDDHAIAARLSYLLCGTTPDAELTKLANESRLHEPGQIRQQVERLLSGDGARRFIQDFAAEWLDLDQIDFTQPDSKLFPTFDAIVQNAMLDETHTFLETLLRDNHSVAQLIDSDFTFLNSRLAQFYDINGVAGDKLQRLGLKPEHRRGGLLTHGAILKITANGTNTSPVVRGAWIADRLLGERIPPPPDNVPAIEPDIRGAKTIREMLAKHRSQDSCASCHVKIDPAGFALENYDPAGRWRDRYVQLIDGRRESGSVIDASYELADGQKFRDLEEFQTLFCSQPQRIARSVAAKLLVFGTGAPISFADRQAVDEIVQQAAHDNYGFRSLIAAVATSSVFLSK